MDRESIHLTKKNVLLRSEAPLTVKTTIINLDLSKQEPEEPAKRLNMDYSQHFYLSNVVTLDILQ